MIYKNDTVPLQVTLITNTDYSAATARYLYKAPDLTEGEWTCTVEQSGNSVDIYYIPTEDYQVGRYEIRLEVTNAGTRKTYGNECKPYIVTVCEEI